MEKFVIHEGVAAPLLRDNVDTDAIIPSREMKTVSKTGLGIGLFSAWRYMHKDTRELNSDFVLNKPEYRDASILLSADNFGCGSSREHAVWALKDYGIRCVVAESFGAIFARNCLRNGILTVELPKADIKIISDYVEQGPEANTVEVDLKNQLVRLRAGSEIPFEIRPSDKEILLEGMDQISMTLAMSSQIDTFIEKDRRARPWIHC